MGRRLGALLVAGLMTVGLAACGTDTETTAATNAQTAAQPTAGAPSSSTGPIPTEFATQAPVNEPEPPPAEATGAPTVAPDGDATPEARDPLNSQQDPVIDAADQAPADAPLCQRLSHAEVVRVLGGTAVQQQIDASQCVYATSGNGEVSASVAVPEMIAELPDNEVVDLPELRVNGADQFWLHLTGDPAQPAGASLVIRQGDRHILVAGERVTRDQLIALAGALLA